MYIVKREDLEKFTKSDNLREFLLSATDYELSVIELSLRCFGTVTTSVSHTNRNNRVAALAILKLVEEARKQRQDPPSLVVGNTAERVTGLHSDGVVEDESN